jgi:hypothetical protein
VVLFPACSHVTARLHGQIRLVGMERETGSNAPEYQTVSPIHLSTQLKHVSHTCDLE